MKKVSLGKLVGGLLAAKETASPWRPEGQPYPRLVGLDVQGLVGKQGVYVVWHLGVRPQWLRIGAAADLAAALSTLSQAAWVAQHQSHAGVFAAWAFVAPPQAAGTVRFLVEKLQPAFQHADCEHDLPVDPAVAPIAIVLPPGTGV